MTKRRVQLFGQQRGIEIEADATIGATVGIDLRWPDGSLVTEEDLRGSGDGGGGDYPETFWRLIQEIPPNVVALAEQAGTGVYVIGPGGTSFTREVVAGSQLLVVTNGDGTAGDISVDLGAAGFEVPPIRVSWGDASAPIYTADRAGYISAARIEIDEAFSDPAATVSIGTEDDPEAIIPAAWIAPAREASYASTPSVRLDPGDSVVATIDPGTSSAGSGLLFMTFVPAQ